jgi:hypothetical protein
MCQALAAPRRLPSRHVPPQHPARHFPACAGPLRASPRRAAAARAITHLADLPAPAPAHSCLLLDPEHILKLPTHSLLLSRVYISTTLLFLEVSTSPDLRRSYCSSLTAAAAAAHPRSSARAAPQQPTKAHKPAQIHSPALDRPDHSAVELELPPPLGLAVVPLIHRLLAPAKYHTAPHHRVEALRPLPHRSPTLRPPERRCRPSDLRRLPVFVVDPPPRPFSFLTPATPETAVSP